MLARVRRRLRRSDPDPASLRTEAPAAKYERAPILLRQRSSTWFIALAVGFGGT